MFSQKNVTLLSPIQLRDGSRFYLPLDSLEKVPLVARNSNVPRRSAFFFFLARDYKLLVSVNEIPPRSFYLMDLHTKSTGCFHLRPKTIFKFLLLICNTLLTVKKQSCEAIHR